MSELFNENLKTVRRNQHHGVHCHCRRRDTLVQKKASLLVELGCRGLVGRLPGFSEYISLLLAPINVVDLTTEQSHSPLTTADFTITILGSSCKMGIIEHILRAGTCPYWKDNLLLMLIEHILCVGFCLYCKKTIPRS